MQDERKKYYWLKLQRDFFKRHDIKIIENMMNGKDYILFYLKLLCESVDHNGNLRFNENIPYNEEMLAVITNTNVDTVRSAIRVFSQLGMIEILDDGTYYMNEMQKMIGSETKWAEKKRIYRQKQKENQIEAIEDKQENNREVAKGEVDSVINSFNATCKSLKQVLQINSIIEDDLLNTLSVYTTADFKKAFEKTEASDFLKGKTGGNWKASFGWIVKKDNLEKILAGNYDNDRQFKKESKNSNEEKTDFEAENEQITDEVKDMLGDMGVD